jgi:hypothetical protein
VKLLIAIPMAFTLLLWVAARDTQAGTDDGGHRVPSGRAVSASSLPAVARETRPPAPMVGAPGDVGTPAPGAFRRVSAEQGAHDFWRRVESGNSPLLTLDGENEAVVAALNGRAPLAAALAGKLLTPRPRPSESPAWDARVSRAVAAGRARSLGAALGGEQRAAAFAELQKRSRDAGLRSWDLVAVADAIALVGWTSPSGRIGQGPQTVMIDTLNTPFDGLSDPWKGKNAAAVAWARQHEDLVAGYTTAELSEALNHAVERAFITGAGMAESLRGRGPAGRALVALATAIHETWMASNPREDWNRHLFVPFADLPAPEQLKDINGLAGRLRARR